MLGLLKKFWNWLKSFWQTSPSPAPVAQPEPTSLDYENALMEILRGGAATAESIKRILMNQGISDYKLARWMEQKGQEWLSQPQNHRELGERLEYLSTLASGELARVAGNLGRELTKVQEEEPLPPVAAVEPPEPTPPLEVLEELKPLPPVAAVEPPEPTPPLEVLEELEPLPPVAAVEPPEPTPPLEVLEELESLPPVAASEPPEPTPPLEVLEELEPLPPVAAVEPPEPLEALEEEEEEAGEHLGERRRKRRRGRNRIR